MDIGRGASHTGVCCRGLGEGQLVGSWGGIAWGGRQQNTLPCVYLCNYLACSAHIPQNLKCNKKRKRNFPVLWATKISLEMQLQLTICGFNESSNPGLFSQWAKDMNRHVTTEDIYEATII